MARRNGPAWVLGMAIAAAVAVGARSAPGGAIEAKVNNRIITTNDILTQAKGRLKHLAERKAPDLETQTRALLKSALRELIESKLLEDEGERVAKGFPKVKDLVKRAVREEIEKERREYGGEGKLRDYVEGKLKLTYSEYKKRLRLDQLRRLVLQRDVYRNIVIRPSEMRDHYNKNTGSYRTPARATFRVIHLGLESKEDLPKQLKRAEELTRRARGGEKFRVLVKDYSTGPRVEEGGKRENVVLDHLTKPLREALKKMRPGHVSDPVVSDDAIRILKLDDVVAEKVRPFDEVQQEIRSGLSRRKRARKYVRLMGRLWRENYVWIRGLGRVRKRPKG